jgi:prepilin-type processing-associated H-X9-DG protein
MRLTDIWRGSSNTILIGEKYLNPVNYKTGTDPGDNECMYTGMNNDVVRCTGLVPLLDTPGVQNTLAFGSLHPSGPNFMMADGSVNSIAYNVELSVFRPMGDRTGNVQN